MHDREVAGRPTCAGEHEIGLPGWSMCAITDTGRVRTRNEDCLALMPKERTALLADGMGGHAAGEVASRIAVDAAVDFLSRGVFRGQTLRDQVRHACHIAHEAVVSAAKADEQFSGMGTTLIVVRFQGSQLAVAHLGDSRAYRWRHNCLVQLTRDHSLAEELLHHGTLDAGEAAYSLYRHTLTRAAGIEPGAEPDVYQQRWQPGDLYLLCSDGLSDAVSDGEIAALLVENRDNLGDSLARLIDTANGNGGPDNISAILIQTGVPK
ncbi:MAG: protein phosphatase 2C domain-containing protein [Acidiferrobacteraceae bacterium]